MLIAASVPILWMIVASSGGTGAVARDLTGFETVRRPADRVASSIPVPDVPLARLRPTESPLLSRDPFAFAPRSLSPSPHQSIAPPAEAPPDLPPAVVLSLIGMATTIRADGHTERTAIIAGPANALFMVRDGDAVISYRVDAVLADSVRLVDNATGAALSLLLR